MCRVNKCKNNMLKEFISLISSNFATYRRKEKRRVEGRPSCYEVISKDIREKFIGFFKDKQFVKEKVADKKILVLFNKIVQNDEELHETFFNVLKAVVKLRKFKMIKDKVSQTIQEWRQSYNVIFQKIKNKQNPTKQSSSRERNEFAHIVHSNALIITEQNPEDLLNGLKDVPIFDQEHHFNQYEEISESHKNQFEGKSNKINHLMDQSQQFERYQMKSCFILSHLEIEGDNVKDIWEEIDQQVADNMDYANEEHEIEHD